MAEYAACSTTVGDAGRDNPAPLQDLIDDLAHRTHDEAMRHYRVDPERCSYRAFAGERDERAAFAAFMDTVAMPAERQAEHLRTWDEAQRAVAVVHWFHVVLPA